MKERPVGANTIILCGHPQQAQFSQLIVCVQVDKMVHANTLLQLYILCMIAFILKLGQLMSYVTGKKGKKSPKPAPITATKIGKASLLMKKHGMDKRQSMKSQQKPKAVKQRSKARGPLKNNITYDPRVQSDRNEFSDTELNITKHKLTEFMCVAGNFITSDSENGGFENDEFETNKQTDPFIFQKVKVFLRNGKSSHALFFNELQISDEEKAVIECSTRGQGEFWKFQRQGFVTSTKIKEAFTR